MFIVFNTIIKEHENDQLSTSGSAVQLRHKVRTQPTRSVETTDMGTVQETVTPALKRTLRRGSPVNNNGIDLISADTFEELEVNTVYSQTGGMSDSDSDLKMRNNVRNIGTTAAECGEAKLNLGESIHQDDISGCESSDAYSTEHCKVKDNEGLDDSDYCSLSNGITLDLSNECAVSGNAGSLTQKRLVSEEKTESWKGRFRQSMFYKVQHFCFT